MRGYGRDKVFREVGLHDGEWRSFWYCALRLNFACVHLVGVCMSDTRKLLPEC